MAQMTMTEIYKLNNILTQARNAVEDVTGNGKLNGFVNKDAETIFMTLNELCLLTVEMREKWDMAKTYDRRKEHKREDV